MSYVKPQRFKQFRLPENRGTQIPKRQLFFDSETEPEVEGDDSVHRFKMGWSCHIEYKDNLLQKSKTWRFWEDEREFCRYVHNLGMQGKNLTILGHNIFFDLQACGFFGYMTDWGWVLDFVYDRGLTYILKCSKDGHHITCLSTTNWFDQGLSELGELIGLPKLDVDFETSCWADLQEYCKRDVEIIIEAMGYYINFVREHDLGRFGMTKSSQAMNAFRHRFMDEKIMIHKDDQVVELERQAYMGGRTEAYQIGEVKGSPFVSLDVNSMYPFVMKNFTYPCQLVRYEINPQVEDFVDILKNYAVIAEIEVNTDEPVYAVHHNKKVVFPTGRFVCTVCSEGLRYAMSRGHVNKISRAAIYTKKDLFTGYVDYFYNLRWHYRSKGNGVMEKLCKYMLNSLYGKFGQKKPILEEYQTDTGRQYSREEIYDTRTGQIILVTSLMNKMIFHKGEEESKLSFPGIAAHITENARLVLWQVIQSTGIERVLYCDTDSIKIRWDDLKNVTWPRDDKALGALKIEKKSDYLYIGGAKNYIEDDTRHIKGIPARAEKVAHNTYQFPVFYSQITHLRRTQDVGFRVGSMTRVVSEAYDKGVVTGSGRVVPFRFECVHPPP